MTPITLAFLTVSGQRTAVFTRPPGPGIVYRDMQGVRWAVSSLKGEEVVLVPTTGKTGQHLPFIVVKREV